MEKLLISLLTLILLSGCGFLLALVVFLVLITRQTQQILSCLLEIKGRLPEPVTSTRPTIATRPHSSATELFAAPVGAKPLAPEKTTTEPGTTATSPPPGAESAVTGKVRPSGPSHTALADAAAVAAVLSQPPSSPSPPPPPRPCRPPSPLALAVRARMQLWWNWLLYGQTQSPAQSGQRAEKLAATTWLLRAGILVIVFTAAFLLKLSIERGILAPAGRVALSYAWGAALLLWGLKMLNGTYQRLGQAILGISLVLFYFSTYALSAMYHLAPEWTAAMLLILTTVAAGVIAHHFNSLAVALIAILGGYGTPLMLHTGSKNYPALFAYMLLLGLGVLWLALKRNWLPLNWLAMLFCYALYYLSYWKFYAPEDFLLLLLALFLFFALYSTATFIHNLRRRIPATVLEVLALLTNASLFFLLSWLLIDRQCADRLYFAPLTLGLALFYVAHAYLFLHLKLSDKGLVLSFLGLAAFFLALTFPVVLAEEWLGAAWALQALLMLWLGFTLQSRFLRATAWLLFGLILLRYLFYDLSQAFSGIRPQDSDLFLSDFWSRLVQFCVPIAALAAAARLCQRPPATADLSVPPGSDLKERRLPASPPLVLLGFGAALLFLYLNLEIYRTIGFCYAPLRSPAITWLWLLAAFVLARLTLHCPRNLWRHLFTALLLAILAKTFLHDFLDVNRPGWQMLYTLPAFLWRDSAMRILNFAVLVLALSGFQAIFREQEQR